MINFKNFLSLTIFVFVLSSCSSMNITEEKVFSNEVKTVETMSMNKDKQLDYSTKAINANATVYFDFDQSSLTSRSLQTLKSTVNALNNNLAITITISGHADERGTREYNLALGQRRAETVSSDLVLNGIDQSRITVISFCEEKPVAFGQDENSFSKNRRVEIN